MAKQIGKLREKWKGLPLLFRLALMLGVLLAAFVIPQATDWLSPNTPDIGEIKTWFYRSDSHTVNGLTAKILGDSQSSSSDDISRGGSGNVQVWAAVRVFVRYENGGEHELTDGSYNVNVTRSSDSEGIQNVTWNCPQTMMNTTDAVVVRVYLKVGSDSWGMKGEWITDKLYVTQLNSATWTFCLYTKRDTVYNPITKLWTTSIYFYFGSSTYNSRIADVSLPEASAPPSASNIGYETSAKEIPPVTFHVYWTAGSGNLSHYRFYSNISGTFQADSWQPFPQGVTEAWSNVTKNFNGECVVQWKMEANNTEGLYTNTTLQTTEWIWGKPKYLVYKKLGLSIGGARKGIFYNATATGGKAAIYVCYSNSSFDPWKIQVRAYDVEARTWTPPCNVCDNLGTDTHYNPSMSILPDGRLIVLYGYYGYLTYRISIYNATIESNLTKLISNWGSEQQKTTSSICYPVPVRWDDKLLVFARKGGSQSGDLVFFNWTGSGFSDPTTLVQGSTGYQRSSYFWVRKNGTNVLVGYTIYSHSQQKRFNAHLMWSPDKGDTWKAVNGTVLTLPLDTFDNSTRCIEDSDTWQVHPLIDENNKPNLFIIKRQNLNWTWIKVAVYSSELNNTGTWSYGNATFEDNTVMEGEYLGFSISRAHYYSQRPQIFVAPSQYDGRMVYAVRLPNEQRKFRIISIRNETYYIQSTTPAQIEDTPPYYTCVMHEKWTGVLSNLTEKSFTSDYWQLDTLYGVKLKANITEKLSGVEVYAWKQQLTGMWRAALYNTSFHKIAETSLGKLSGADGQYRWIVQASFKDPVPTVQKGVYYWLVFTTNITSCYKYTYDNVSYQGMFSYSYSFTDFQNDPFPSSLNTSQINYMNRTCRIRVFPAYVVVRGVGEPTFLSVGWNQIEAVDDDVGHTLMEVNASLHVDNINFTVITFSYPNGTQISLHWLQATDEYWVENTTMTVTSDTTIWIYCKETGVWCHNYAS